MKVTTLFGIGNDRGPEAGEAPARAARQVEERRPRTIRVLQPVAVIKVPGE